MDFVRSGFGAGLRAEVDLADIYAHLRERAQNHFGVAAGAGAFDRDLRGVANGWVDGDQFKARGWIFLHCFGNGHVNGLFIVHVWLVKFDFDERAGLTERHGLVFPDLGFGGRTHGGVIGALRDIEKGGASGEAVFEAIDRLADVDGRSYLLSTENFELMPPRRIEMFAERIRRRHDVRIVAYVRDLTRLMPSVYAQRTKKGRNLRDFDAF